MPTLADRARRSPSAAVRRTSFTESELPDSPWVRGRRRPRPPLPRRPPRARGSAGARGDGFHAFDPSAARRRGGPAGNPVSRLLVRATDNTDRFVESLRGCRKNHAKLARTGRPDRAARFFDRSSRPGAHRTDRRPSSSAYGRARLPTIPSPAIAPGGEDEPDRVRYNAEVFTRVVLEVSSGQRPRAT